MTNSTITQEVLTENLIEIKKSVLKPKGTMVKGSRAVDVNKYLGKLPQEIGTDYSFKRKIVWPNVIGFIILHLFALYAIYRRGHYLTGIWTIIVGVAAGEGITMGAHRFYAHKTFKAHFLVRLGLILLQTVAGQNCMYIWVRDHRLHHKYSDTDADPHNANRGFFFSHMGWLMSRKHPAVIAKGRTIDMSDLEADSLVMLQMKFYNALYILFAITVPVLVPVLLWNEGYLESLLLAYFLRYIVSLHFTWLVNSAAHFYGTKPYDHTMRPVQSWVVSVLSIGEGWHNYHHVFPWDYRASELGTKFNITTMIIDILAFFHLVYDRKSAPDHMVEHRALRTGDGSHPVYGPVQEENDAEVLEENDNNLKITKIETSLHETVIPPANIITKKDLEINHNEEIDTESIIIRDSSNGETTTVKRIVKEKFQTHG